MEWEKEESHERVQESGYDVELTGPPGLELADGMRPDMALAARGWMVWEFPGFVRTYQNPCSKVDIICTVYLLYTLHRSFRFQTTRLCLSMKITRASRSVLIVPEGMSEASGSTDVVPGGVPRTPDPAHRAEGYGPVGSDHPLHE